MQSEKSKSLVTYKDKVYCLRNIPSKSSELVREKAEDIKVSMDLDTLSTQFQTVGKWVRIAYCGVAGNIKLEMQFRDRLIEVDDLCNSTIVMLNKFNRSCQRALETMEVAFTLLEENHDSDALNKMINVQDTASSMIKDATAVLKKCEAQKKSVNELVKDTMTITGDTDGKKAEMIGKIKSHSESEKTIEAEQKTKSKEEKVHSEQRDKEEKELLEVIGIRKLLENEYNDHLKEAGNINKKKLRKIKIDQDAKRQNAHEELRLSVTAAEKQCDISISEAGQHYQIKVVQLKSTVEDKLSALKLNYQETLKVEKSALQAKLDSHAAELTNTLDRSDKMYKYTETEYNDVYKSKLAEAESAYDAQIQTNATQLKRKLLENQIEHDNETAAIELQLKVDKKKHWFRTTAEEEESRKNRATSAKTKLANDNKKANETKDQSDKLALTERNTKKHTATKEKVKAMNDAKSKKEKDDQNAKSEKNQKDKEAHKLFAQLGQRNDGNAASDFIMNSNEADYEQADRDKKKLISIAEDNKRRAVDIAQREYDDLINSFAVEIKSEEDAYAKIMLDITETYNQKLSEMVKKISGHEAEVKNQKSRVEALKKEQSQAKADMMKFAAKIVSLQGELKHEEDIAECLKIAKQALEKILNTVKGIDRFWTEVLDMCTDITTSKFGKSCQATKDKGSQDRQKSLTSSGFKIEALHFIGKWVAIKEVCIVTNKQLTYTQNEVRRYVSDTPNRDEAKQLAIAMKSYESKLQNSTDIVPYT